MIQGVSQNSIQNITSNDYSAGLFQWNGTCESWGNWSEYGFMVRFSQNSNYVLVPMTAFLTYDATNDQCMIMVQRLDSEEEDSGNVVLGALFMSQYVNYWTFGGNNTNTTLQIWQSPSC